VRARLNFKLVKCEINGMLGRARERSHSLFWALVSWMAIPRTRIISSSQFPLQLTDPVCRFLSWSALTLWHLITKSDYSIIVTNCSRVHYTKWVWQEGDLFQSKRYAFKVQPWNNWKHFLVMHPGRLIIFFSNKFNIKIWVKITRLIKINT